ncbi:MAG: SDR family oxidoreductase [Planctomycetota bacterium]
MPQVLIIGCGETGCRVAQLEQASGNAVLGIVRSASACEKLASLKIPFLQVDLDQVCSFWREGWCESWIYYFVPPLNATLKNASIETLLDLRLDCFLKNFSPRSQPSKMLLSSTTGVYGNCNGRWINESTPPNPQSMRSKQRLAAESLFLSRSQPLNFSAVILRIAAIYGSGRLPLEKIRQQQPVLPLEKSPWTNRIHIDDLAQVCFLAMRKELPSLIYNVSDGHPLRMTDYFFQVADFFHLTRPPILPLAEARLQWTPEFLSYWEESKRLENRYLLEDLQLQLKYPNLQSGLVAEVNH